ncbi:MAG TPA: DUF2087 domain-containing protein [Candidatus Brachybacterium merdigallinarum]|nr:DUF2087 domain-containing protein [Candidatus Brachybacterium merdigallinarum]
MLVAMLSTPKLRHGLARLLRGEPLPEDPSVRGPLSRLDWLTAGGDTAADAGAAVEAAVDVEALREITEALSVMRSDQAILEVGRLAGIPVKTEESREVSGRIARIVFERIGVERTLSEAELNAAIAMFAQDVALVRRDTVDAGVLTRSADGTAYRLA